MLPTTIFIALLRVIATKNAHAPTNSADNKTTRFWWVVTG